MPPKKASTNGDANDAGGKFTWEGPNDTKLLLLTQGRYVKPEEYANLATAMGTSEGSIRNRISTLRVKQRNMYEALKWQLPEGGATKKTSPKKRGAAGADDDGSGEQETPTKKARKKKGVKEEKVESESEGDGKGLGPDEGAGFRIKEEEVEGIDEEI
ncbi:hypothetical protein FB567DRAFT_592363 [Paraphoma chrysanthemicola]|uniref:Uncharacterized protein n=1 Tax=Paraphoma chrysanthemicola TaxID=798071 RepID=A0A8K0R5U1_9PLEO|nr:hypothetical protein FB567DRAFT_592363 [Paraphoma chrysanthemicola]